MILFLSVCLCHSSLKSQVEDMQLEAEALQGDVTELKKRIETQQTTLKKAKALLVKTENEKAAATEFGRELEKVSIIIYHFFPFNLFFSARNSLSYLGKSMTKKKKKK